MKTTCSLHRPILALALGLLGLGVSRASAQTVINSVPYTINASGHYQLGGNLNYNNTGSPAITISAPNVILDLNGFYVAGAGNPATSFDFGNSVIYVTDVANVTIKNGTVAGSSYGVYFGATTAANARNYVVDSVVVTRCYMAGLYFPSHAAPGSVIKNCSFSTIGNSAFTAITYPCAIYTEGGIRMENNNIGDVTATGNGTSTGIAGFNGDFMIGNTIANCKIGITFGKCLNNLTYNVATPFQSGIYAVGNN